MRGEYCDLVPLSTEAHAAELYEAYTAPVAMDLWTYTGPDTPPTESRERFEAWVAEDAALTNRLVFAVVERGSGKALGTVAHQAWEPEHGVIEVGHVIFGRDLQQTAAATEAISLLLRRAFDELGYRRVQWECDALNAASRRAAERLGFGLEGILRQHRVTKLPQRSRDTAMFAMTDGDWQGRVRGAHEAWLGPGNFVEGGRQRSRLSELVARPKL